MSSICAARTNYFRVAPEKWEAFLAWAKHYRFEIVSEKTRASQYFPGPPGTVALLAGSWTDDGSFPSWDEEKDEKTGDGSVDIAADLVGFLAPGSVAILMEVGFDKMRYFIGWAEAVDSTGRRVSMNLLEIYEKVTAEFPGAEATRAEY